ncbi:MAG: hypothetical protein ACI841_000323 [Planctomycetota bacterium]|jgi:hypothetical protein
MNSKQLITVPFVLALTSVAAAQTRTTTPFGGSPGAHVAVSTHGLQLIADTNTPAPGGGGEFSLFADARAIDAGRVAFIAHRSGGGSGIFTYENGSLAKLFDTNTTVPGTGSSFQSFFDVSLDGDIVDFTAGWPGPGGGCAFNGSEGLFLSAFDGSGLLSVFDSVTSSNHCFHGVDSRQGDVSVCAGVLPVDNIHNHSETVYLSSQGGAFNVLADLSTPAPGGGSFLGFNQEVVLQSNAYAFADVIFNTFGAVAGVYADHGDGLGLQLVANSATPVPGGAGTFNNIAGFDYDRGEVAFVARDASNISALYAGTCEADLRIIADRSSQVPGEPGNFLGISNPIAAEGGEIAFSGFWGGGGQGLFLARNGNLHALLKKGDVVDGSVVEQAFCRTQCKNGRTMLIEIRFLSSPALSHRGLYLLTL